MAPDGQRARRMAARTVTSLSPGLRHAWIWARMDLNTPRIHRPHAAIQLRSLLTACRDEHVGQFAEPILIPPTIFVETDDPESGVGLPADQIR